VKRNGVEKWVRLIVWWFQRGLQTTWNILDSSSRRNSISTMCLDPL